MREASDLVARRRLRGGTAARGLFGLLLCVAASGPAHAAGMTVKGAWTPPNASVGSDAVLGMVLKNEDAEADALLRASCPVATFAEKRQIDIGEGGKSAREVREIPVPGGASLTLDKEHFHIALLQITNKLDAGQDFECSLSFRRGGKVKVSVKVLEKAPGS